MSKNASSRMETAVENQSAKINGVKFKNNKNMHALFFSKADFDRWFAMKSKEVKGEFESKLRTIEELGFGIDGSVPFDGVNEFLLLMQGKKCIVYRWCLPNGPWPLRRQDTDDLTDYFSTLK